MTIEEARERIRMISEYALTIVAVSNQSMEYSAEQHMSGMKNALELIYKRLEGLYVELGGEE